MSHQNVTAKNHITQDTSYRESTSSLFSRVCLIVECEELLDSVQQYEGEQRTAEEQEALSDALNTVTQVPFTAWGTLNTSTDVSASQIDLETQPFTVSGWPPKVPDEKKENTG